MKPRTHSEEEEQQKKAIQIKDLRKRPYGLCAKVGISTRGMSPREAWGVWNAYRKAEREYKKNQKKSKRKLQNRKAAATFAKSSVMKPGARASTMKKDQKLLEKPKSAVQIPTLNTVKINAANSNSFFNRGSNSEAAYQAYAAKILSWEISDAKKEQLLGELHKRWEQRLTYEAQHVPWTVAGPARYNSKRLDKSDQVMRASMEVSEWFDKTEKSVKNSKIQYADNRAEKAKRAEEWFHRQISGGMLRKGYHDPVLDPKAVADALTPLAQYDTKRFAELYEKYDAELHFRKGTKADKLYRAVKSGEYTGEKLPTKLHESDHLNLYESKLRSGEKRIFMKFTTRPKPQMVYALKRRGWHWNALEGAWSVPKEKYDETFVKGIDENYAKYL